MEAELVDLPGRAGQRGRGAEQAARFGGVVAQEIDRFAHFEHRVGDGLAGLAHAQREQGVAVIFEQVGGAVEQARPFVATKRVPRGLGRGGGAHHRVDIGGGGVANVADFDSGIERRGHRDRLGALAERRDRGPILVFEFLQPRHQRVALGWVAKVQSGAVATPAGKDRIGEWDVGAALGLERSKLGDRIADQGLDRNIVVGDAVDETRVGAILEQAADEVGEQFLVASDRGVDPHRGNPIADASLESGEFVVEPLAHAVEPLELERSRSGECLDRTDGVGVVGREGRVEHVAGGEHALGAGEVADVGRDLAREHRIVAQARDLRGLDLAVPIGALDEADHELAIMLARQIDDPVGERDRAFGIGLERHPEPAPSVCEQRIVGGERLDDVERQFEPIGLLGIDREMDVGGGGLGGEFAQDRKHRGLGLGGVAPFVARVERAELDRNPRRGAKAPR